MQQELHLPTYKLWTQIKIDDQRTKSDTTILHKRGDGQNVLTHDVAKAFFKSNNKNTKQQTKKPGERNCSYAPNVLPP